MKQFVISSTQESEPFTITVHSKPNEAGQIFDLYTATIPPDASGPTQQVIGLQEGETLTIA